MNTVETLSNRGRNVIMLVWCLCSTIPGVQGTSIVGHPNTECLFTDQFKKERAVTGIPVLRSVQREPAWVGNMGGKISQNKVLNSYPGVMQRGSASPLLEIVTTTGSMEAFLDICHAELHVMLRSGQDKNVFTNQFERERAFSGTIVLRSMRRKPAWVENMGKISQNKVLNSYPGVMQRGSCSPLLQRGSASPLLEIVTTTGTLEVFLGICYAELLVMLKSGQDKTVFTNQFKRERAFPGIIVLRSMRRKPAWVENMGGKIGRNKVENSDSGVVHRDSASPLLGVVTTTGILETIPQVERRQYAAIVTATGREEAICGNSRPGVWRASMVLVKEEAKMQLCPYSKYAVTTSGNNIIYISLGGGRVAGSDGVSPMFLTHPAQRFKQSSLPVSSQVWVSYPVKSAMPNVFIWDTSQIRHLNAVNLSVSSQV